MGLSQIPLSRKFQQKNVDITISQRILVAICCIFVNILDILAIFLGFFGFLVF